MVPPESRELSWEDVRPVDLLGLEVGYRLVPLVDANQGGDLLARVRGVRRKLTSELGFLVPPVHIRDNLEFAPDGLSHQSRRRARGRGRDPSGSRTRHQSRPRVRQGQRHRDHRSGLRHGSGVDRTRARATTRRRWATPWWIPAP